MNYVLNFSKFDPLRRLRYDLVLIYQISNKHTAVDRDDLLFLSTPNNTRSNGYTLFYPSSSNPFTCVVKSTYLCKFKTSYIFITLSILQWEHS